MYEQLIELAREWGPIATVIVFAVWRDWKRETFFMGRVVKLESEIREIIFPIVENTTSTIAKNTEVLKRVESKIDVAWQPHTQTVHQAGAVQP